MVLVEFDDFYSPMQVGFGYLVGRANVLHAREVGRRRVEGNAGQLIGVLGVASASAHEF